MQCRTHLLVHRGLKFTEQVICLELTRLKSMTLVLNSYIKLKFFSDN